MNQTPSLPPSLRFNVHYTTPSGSSSYRRGNDKSLTSIVPDDITPEDANIRMTEYTWAVGHGQVPQLDLHVIRDHIDDALAAQEVEKLDVLEKDVPHAIAGEVPDEMTWKVSENGSEEAPPGFLTTEQEEVYLNRLDAKLDNNIAYNLTTTPRPSREQQHPPAEEKHWAELTPRELERQSELLNPMSQHNWLRTHVKALANATTEGDDNESLASHPDTKPPTSARKRANPTKSTLNLARQVGDRAVERAREGWSPGVRSAYRSSICDSSHGTNKGTAPICGWVNHLKMVGCLLRCALSVAFPARVQVPPVWVTNHFVSVNENVDSHILRVRNGKSDPLDHRSPSLAILAHFRTDTASRLLALTAALRNALDGCACCHSRAAASASYRYMLLPPYIVAIARTSIAVV